MVPLVVWFASFGVCDVVADLSGRPRGGLRSWLGLGLGVLTSWGIGQALGASSRVSLAFAVLAGVSVGFWLWARTSWLRKPDSDGWVQWKAILLSWAYVGATLSILVSLPLWPETTSDASLSTWIARLPFNWAEDLNVEVASLGAAGFVWLAATGNALVRLVFASIGEDVPRGAEPLKGGRIIGPMERGLILALLLLDSATAAGIVVAGKGLLRFAEIRSEAPVLLTDRPGGEAITDVQWKTEYLLVGSLASWVLPLLVLVFMS